MTETRKKLLTEFIAVQLFQMPGEPPYLNDGCMGVRYDNQTLYDVGMTKPEMKKEMLLLRDDGIVELKPTVSSADECTLCGSAYFLTDEGLEYIKQHFTNEEFEKLI